jgi:hypothetical protein
MSCILSPNWQIYNLVLIVLQCPRGSTNKDIHLCRNYISAECQYTNKISILVSDTILYISNTKLIRLNLEMVQKFVEIFIISSHFLWYAVVVDGLFHLHLKGPSCKIRSA